MEGLRKAVEAAEGVPGVSQAALAEARDESHRLEAALDELARARVAWGGCLEDAEELAADLTFLGRNASGLLEELQNRLPHMGSELAAKAAAVEAAQHAKLDAMAQEMAALADESTNCAGRSELLTDAESDRRREHAALAAECASLEQKAASMLAALEAESAARAETRRQERAALEATLAVAGAEAAAAIVAREEAQRQSEDVAKKIREVTALLTGREDMRDGIAADAKELDAEWMRLVAEVDAKLQSLEPLKQQAASSSADVAAAMVLQEKATAAAETIEAELRLCQEATEAIAAKEEELQAKCRDVLRPHIRQQEVEVEQLEKRLEDLKMDYQNFACGLFAQVMGSPDSDDEGIYLDDGNADDDDDDGLAKKRSERRRLRSERRRLGTLLGLVSGASPKDDQGDEMDEEGNEVKKEVPPPPRRLGESGMPPPIDAMDQVTHLLLGGGSIFFD
jgi:chromosome segregation ATPase